MTNIFSILLEKNCIKKGEFILKNGEKSKYYFDMKNLISHPSLLKTIGDLLWSKIKPDNLKNLKICGVAFGGLPVAFYISSFYNIPMIMVRKNVKNYGTKKLIEGEFSKTDNCIIIEDVVTTGNSLKEVYDILKNHINIIDIGVIIKRRKIDNMGDVKINYLLDSKDILN